jgi:hypothetical protein
LDEVRVSRLLAQYDLKQAPPPNENATISGELIPIQLDRCDTSSLNYKVVEALLFLQDLPLFQSKKDDFDSDIIGPSAEKFFAARTQQVVVRNETDKSCADATLAIARKTDGVNVLSICPHAGKFSKVVLAGMLVHESRHFDGIDTDKEHDFGHVGCLQGDLVGSLSCDPAYSHHGAYAVETELYIKMARAESLPEDIRLQARGWAIDRLTYRFNTQEFGVVAQALLRGEDGVLYRSDAKSTITPFATDIPKETIVTLRSNIPVVFDREAGTVQSYMAGAWIPTEGPFANLLRQMDVSERRRAVDLYYGPNACLLFPEEMLCKHDAEIVRVKMPEGYRARQFVPMRQIFAGTDVVTVLMEGGQMFAFPSSEKLSEWPAQGFMFLDQLKNYKGLGVMPGYYRISVLADGSFAVMGESKYEPLPALAGYKFTSLLAPFLYSDRFDEI